MPSFTCSTIGCGGRVPVQLSTAETIDDALAAQIAENLRQLLGGQPILTRSVDPALIGGAVVCGWATPSTTVRSPPNWKTCESR